MRVEVNDTDPDSKTKIITKLRIKLLHRKVVDNLEVKVDDGAEVNILPLCSFRSLFPNALVGDGYPREGFLRGSRTMLECYNDGKLVNHGSITLKLQHYTNNSFQDHQFFVVETPTCKEIVVGHPASVGLGLIKVICKNIAKSVTATEATPNNLTHIRNIDGRVPRRWPRSRSEPSSGSSGWKGHKFDSFQDQNGQKEHKTSSFQDPISRNSFEYPTDLIAMYTYEMNSFQDLLSRPLHMSRAFNNEESLVILDHELAEITQPKEQSTEAQQEDITADFETPFKTLHINGIQVSSEKDNEDTPFKTPADST